MSLKSVLVILFHLCCYGAANAQISKGAQAPEISLEAIYNKGDGEIPTLASMKGSIVILDFWATWCSPCINAFPKYEEMMRKYADRDVHFIAITSDPKNKLENFLDRVEFTFWIGRDDDKQDFKNYEVMGIPQMFIINREGMIVHRGPVTEEMIEEVLATDNIVQASAEFLLNAEVLEKREVVTNGGFSPGEDPLYNAMYRMLDGEFQARPKPFEQFIIRPSLHPRWGGYGDSFSPNGQVGITLYGHTLEEVFQYLGGLTSTVWVRNELMDSTLYDIIYWKKAEGLKGAREEIQVRFADILDASFDTVSVERGVNLISIEPGNERFKSWEDIPEGTTGLFKPVGKFITQLERTSGEFHLTDDHLKDLHVQLDLDEVVRFPEYDHDALRECLERKGARVTKETRTITTYVLNKKNE